MNISHTKKPLTNVHDLEMTSRKELSITEKLLGVSSSEAYQINIAQIDLLSGYIHDLQMTLGRELSVAEKLLSIYSSPACFS